MLNWPVGYIFDTTHIEYKASIACLIQKDNSWQNALVVNHCAFPEGWDCVFSADCGIINVSSFRNGMSHLSGTDYNALFEIR